MYMQWIIYLVLYIILLPKLIKLLHIWNIMQQLLYTQDFSDFATKYQRNLETAMQVFNTKLFPDLVWTYCLSEYNTHISMDIYAKIFVYLINTPFTSSFFFSSGSYTKV